MSAVYKIFAFIHFLSESLIYWTLFCCTSRLHLFQIYLYQGNLQLAERALETGLSYNFEVREHPLYQLVRARLLIRQGSAKVAVQILKQTIASLSSSDSTTAAGRQPTTKKSSFHEASFFESKTLSASERLTLYLELAEAHRSLSEWVSYPGREDGFQIAYWFLL